MFDELNLAEIACADPSIPASAWSCAATRWWPRTAPARAENCLRAPSVTWLRSSAGSRLARCRARPTSALPSAVWNRYKVKKHFQVDITDDTFTYERKHEQIASEAELDGIYVIRAGRIDPAELAAAGIVRAYKQLKEAEKGFGAIEVRWRSARSTTASRTASAHTC